MFSGSLVTQNSSATRNLTLTIALSIPKHPHIYISGIVENDSARINHYAFSKLHDLVFGSGVFALLKHLDSVLVARRLFQNIPKDFG